MPVALFLSVSAVQFCGGSATLKTDLKKKKIRLKKKTDSIFTSMSSAQLYSSDASALSNKTGVSTHLAARALAVKGSVERAEAMLKNYKVQCCVPPSLLSVDHVSFSGSNNRTLTASTSCRRQPLPPSSRYCRASALSCR